MTTTPHPSGVDDAAQAGLLPIATPKQRINALLAIGLPAGELRKAVGVSEATIRNWIEEATTPREAAARALDDLRTAVVALDEAGVTGEQAVLWLTSRHLNRWLKGNRPIDLMRTDPLAVLATIEDLLYAQQERGQVVHLQVRGHTASADGGRSKTTTTRRRRDSTSAH